MPLRHGGRDAGGGRQVQLFTTPIRAGKLETWKPSIPPATQLSRISDFQNFRFSPACTAPEELSCPGPQVALRLSKEPRNSIE